jgi:hypothetical protein
MERVSEYRYLGMLFTPKLSWNVVLTTLAQHAENVMFIMLPTYVYGCNLHIKYAMFLFDSMISPMLYYGAKIWDFEHVYMLSESVHLKL